MGSLEDTHDVRKRDLPRSAEGQQANKVGADPPSKNPIVFMLRSELSDPSRILRVSRGGISISEGRDFEAPLIAAQTIELSMSRDCYAKREIDQQSRDG